MGARVFVNMPSVQMQSELTDVMRKIWSNSAVKNAILISSKPSSFMAGADISMMQSNKSREEVTHFSQEDQKMFDKLENSSFHCSGHQWLGGLEVGLPGALDIMLTDRNIRADEAKKTGLVHQLVDPLGMFYM
ncbi:hypothetical protein PAMA_006714 [Pampus argenteus]